jgi:hypothetical protein
MDADHNDVFADIIDEHVLELLRLVVRQSYERSDGDDVARAQLYFLLRVCNTWHSIRTLSKHSPDEKVFMVDAGMMLRAMFDAYLQAEYVLSDPSKAVQRANDYLDFEHVERYKLAEKVMKYDNPFVKKLKASPARPEGEKRSQSEYDRVKSRYIIGKLKAGRPTEHKLRTRNKWYDGDLSGIARTLGREAEYDIILATFHGCVHSSAFAVRLGPPISAKYVSHWASTIAARVARLSVQYNTIELDDFHSTLLERLCKPYF